MRSGRSSYMEASKGVCVVCIVSGGGGSGQMSFVRWVWHVDGHVVRVKLCSYSKQIV